METKTIVCGSHKPKPYRYEKDYKHLRSPASAIDTYQKLIREGLSISSPSELIDVVGSAHGVNVSELISGHRTEELVPIRHLIIYILRKCSKKKDHEIASLFHQDRTCVYYACRKID